MGGHRRRLPGRKALAAVVAAVLALALGIGTAMALVENEDYYYKYSGTLSSGWKEPVEYLPSPDIYLSESAFHNYKQFSYIHTDADEGKSGIEFVANGRAGERTGVPVFRMTGSSSNDPDDWPSSGHFEFLVARDDTDSDSKRAGRTIDGTELDVYCSVDVQLSNKIDWEFEQEDPTRGRSIYVVDGHNMTSPTYQYNPNTGNSGSCGILQTWTIKLFEHNTFNKTTKKGTEVTGKYFYAQFEDLDARDHLEGNVDFMIYDYHTSKYIEGVELIDGWDKGTGLYMGTKITTADGHKVSKDPTDHKYGDNGEKLTVASWNGHTFIHGSHDCTTLPDSALAFRAESGLKFVWHGNHNCSTKLGILASPNTGKMYVQKSPAYDWPKSGSMRGDGSATDTAPYSLAGATYGVYESASDAVNNKNVVTTLKTGTSGKTGTAELLAGKTYYVRETKASRGFVLDRKSHGGHGAGVYEITISPGDETKELAVTETPKNDPPGIIVKKVDADTGDPVAGAKFRVRYYPYIGTYSSSDDLPSALRTWTITTGDDGGATLDGSATGSALFTDASGDATAPLGTYAVVETSAPAPYRATDIYGQKKTFVFQLTETNAGTGTSEDDVKFTLVSPSTSETQERANYYIGNVCTVKEPRIRGDIEITKRDADIKATGAAGDYPEGDATFEKAEFEVVNETGRTIISPVDGSDVANGKAVCTIKAGSDGKASTKAEANSGNWHSKQKNWSGALEYGKYKVTEKNPPAGYDANAGWSVELTISEDGQVVSSTMTDPVKRGNLDLYKADFDFNFRPEMTDPPSEPQGDGTLIGAEFSVYNQSDNPVYFNGKIASTGKGKAKASWTDASYLVGTARVSAEDGKASMTGLPYGTYYVKETKAPTGYTLDGSWEKTAIVHVAATGTTVSLSGKDDRVYNKIIRGDFSLEKIDYDFFKMVTDPEPGYEADADQRYDVPEGNATLAGAEFKVYNVSAHDVWVDGRFPTYGTGGGRWEIPDDAQACATLTTALSGKTNSVSLPYGTYVVKETKPPSGYLLNPIMAAGVEFTVRAPGDVIITRPDVNDF